MCVIVIKPSDVQISQQTIRNCWTANPHGAGLSYVKNKTVVIEKGFMKVEDLIERVRFLQKMELIIHFRYATHGLRDAGNCHPFPISTENADLRATKLKTPIALHHNGVIYEVADDKILSDSQVFIRDVLSDYTDEEIECDSTVVRTMMATFSKFALMFANGKIATVGNFYEYDGMRVSNLNFNRYNYEEKIVTQKYFTKSVTKTKGLMV